jgi:Fe-S-cluster containining protein
MELHGRAIGGGRIEIEASCCALGQAGQCTIYDYRPTPCVTFEVGGKSCVETVRRRRDGAQREAVLRALGQPA